MSGFTTAPRNTGELEFPDAPRLFAPGFQNWYWWPSRLGCGRVRPALTQLRVKTPKRLIVPLSIDGAHRFWHSFRSSRDLAIVGLMVLHGLRSCEVLALNREDLQLSELQIRALDVAKICRHLSRKRGFANGFVRVAEGKVKQWEAVWYKYLFIDSRERRRQRTKIIGKKPDLTKREAEDQAGELARGTKPPEQHATFS